MCSGRGGGEGGEGVGEGEEAVDSRAESGQLTVEHRQAAQGREEEREVHSPESSSLSAGMRGIGPVTLGQQFTFNRMGRPACRERGELGELGKREGPAFVVL